MRFSSSIYVTVTEAKSGRPLQGGGCRERERASRADSALLLTGGDIFGAPFYGKSLSINSYFMHCLTNVFYNKSFFFFFFLNFSVAGTWAQGRKHEPVEDPRATP